ncbi:unnamed protein product, partial [Allacma fusca]
MPVSSWKTRWLTHLILISVLLPELIQCDVPENTFCKSDPSQICFDDEEEVASVRAESNVTFRLPPHFAPINYRLLTRPVLDEIEGYERFTSPSKIWISVKCLQDTDKIVLHSNNLTINEQLTTITNLNTSESTRVRNHSIEIQNEFLILDLVSPLKAGESYQIFLDFIAPVYLNRRDGIYRTTYQDPADPSQEKHLVSTLFAPTSARRAFPCFDEPQLKATFSINVGRTENYTTLCNMEQLGTNPIPGLDGWFSDHYDTSEPMSTYLAAFLIHNFENHTIENQVSGRLIQTWADPHHVENNGAAYATNISAQILPFFEQYLNYSFALPKLDSVAMPKISYAGMESWGLIIYQESSLLYFPGKSTEQQRRRTTALVAHELSHQWFGNLVTFDWWSDVWLSEGLSTYFQYVAVSKLFPEFDAWTNFVSDVFQSALVADANSITTHPLHQSIEKAQDIFTIYDKIAYDKGASIVRMIEHFLTEPFLKAALQNYVKTYNFQAIHQDQFFEVLNSEAIRAGAIPENATMKNIMDTWTLQSGYPLIRVAQILGEKRISFEQEKYDPDGTNDKATWWVPIKFTLEKDPDFENTFPDLWIAPDEKQVSVEVSRGEEEWILVNADSTGFYRVVYDSNLTESIQRQLYLNHTAIPVSARCRLIDDYFSVSYKNQTAVETALNMISYVGKETDFAVWKTVFTHLKYIGEMLTTDDSHLTSWLNMKLESAFDIIDSELSPEKQEEAKGAIALRRHFLMTWGCYFKLPRCISYATNLIKKWMKTPDNNPIPQAMKSTIYCAIASGNDTDLTEFLMSRYKNEKDMEEKYLLIEGLGCARNLNTIQTELTIMGQNLLNGTEPNVLITEEKLLKTLLKGAIKTSDAGRLISWKFIRDFFDEASKSKKLGVTTSFGEVVSLLSNYWNTPNEREDFASFINTIGADFEKGAVSPVLRSVLAKSFQASLERVDVNIDWMQKFSDRIQN